jgi:hypothetical protein
MLIEHTMIRAGSRRQRVAKAHCIAVLLSLALAQASSAAQNEITVKDLTPKFLQFYASATAQPNLSDDARFALWKKEYDFAAVPPTPEGDKIARRLLDQAWPKYPAALPKIKQGAAGIRPSPQATLDRVTGVLRPDKPVELALTVYVGGFEGNAYTAGDNGHARVAIPVEQSEAERGPVMTHEFVHATQISMGSMAGGWIRSIGATVLSEGLAMRVTQHLYPALPVTSLIEMSEEPGWLAKANTLKPQILRDVRSVLSSTDSKDVFRYTMGTAGAGIDREAYYAGWLVVDYWLHHGMSYADIARIPENAAPERVGAAIDALLAGSAATH